MSAQESRDSVQTGLACTVRPCFAIPLSAAHASCGGSGHTKGYHYGAIGRSAATICLKAQRPVSVVDRRSWQRSVTGAILKPEVSRRAWRGGGTRREANRKDRKSTRLNSSH